MALDLKNLLQTAWLCFHFSGTFRTQWQGTLALIHYFMHINCQSLSYPEIFVNCNIYTKTSWNLHSNHSESKVTISSHMAPNLFMSPPWTQKENNCLFCYQVPSTTLSTQRFFAAFDTIFICSVVYVMFLIPLVNEKRQKNRMLKD